MLLEEGSKPSNTWYGARFGEDTIIANLDTGTYLTFAVNSLDRYLYDEVYTWYFYINNNNKEVS